MELNATYIKNNFGTVLKTLDTDEVIVRKNGRAVAKIVRYEDPNDRYVVRGVRDGAAYYGVKNREVSYEEYVALCEGSENRYELIFGQVYMLASPRVTHQNVVGEIYGQFYNFFKGKDCVPFIAPFDITLEVEGEKNVVQPDIGVICDMDEFKDDRDYYMGVPSLVVEVLSDSTRSKDMVKKLNLYMLSGVREYWIVDIKGETMFVYGFEDMKNKDVQVYRFGEVVESILFEGLEIEF